MQKRISGILFGLIMCMGNNAHGMEKAADALLNQIKQVEEKLAAALKKVDTAASAQQKAVASQEAPKTSTAIMQTQRAQGEVDKLEAKLKSLQKKLENLFEKEEKKASAVQGRAEKKEGARRMGKRGEKELGEFNKMPEVIRIKAELRRENPDFKMIDDKTMGAITEKIAKMSPEEQLQAEKELAQLYHMIDEVRDMVEKSSLSTDAMEAKK